MKHSWPAREREDEKLMGLTLAGVGVHMDVKPRDDSARRVLAVAHVVVAGVRCTTLCLPWAEEEKERREKQATRNRFHCLLLYNLRTFSK